ncbi:hypothetical protein WJX74_000106 [Apatococcus lobatus]|uniref:Uncharacterized protein n=2 Tax=Apatococcus TaxID=904362 RepID=A0AAW1RR25_9CHLO
MAKQNASVAEGPAPAHPSPAETSDGSVQASQHTLNHQLPAETSSEAARVDGTSQINAKLTPVKQQGSMEAHGDEPFSGVAVGAAFGGAFGAGIGAIYDAHHAADLTDLDAK